MQGSRTERRRRRGGREEAVSTRVACKAQNKRRGRDRGKQVKIKEYI